MKNISPFILLFILLTGSFIYKAEAQILLSGTVYDSSKIYAVPGVTVFSTSGTSTLTDSLGNYHITVFSTDSVYFYFREKFSLKFPVLTMPNYNAFDISLRVSVPQKYKLLKGVTVYSDTYVFDSIENRESYKKLFGYQNPTLRSGYEPGGAAGLDLNELIGMFQFKKNKQRFAFRNLMIQQERDSYVDYRFSSITISRITGLKGKDLEKYKKRYRPSYFFIVNSTLTEFYKYILNTSYVFKRENGVE